ncbi:carbohydrate ABC transporter permease [Lacrimispora sp.]|jgi:oligogalacturonide transport system permease protein|uniref:carbohydrate ABC transporter permease n=1 Tax=Lacrimispora sp. TaxID=2719234 RepID=UPI0028A677A0|nr:carbohydrate ABC transporter permease [Lacrimispora sp.]
MTKETKRQISTAIRYTLLIAVGFIMVYPLIWMVGATFKTNSEIFTSAWFWPKNPVMDGYDNAFVDYGGKINLIKSMLNTYKIVVPKVIFTVFSATITAYGFGRFEFKGKAIMFSLMISTLFLPQVVLNAPQYIMFNQWGWTNSYLPLVIPSLFAGDTYFLFMLVQFLRGVPKELEEAAKIDGCSYVKTLWYVIVPMLKPSLVSVALFQFMWTTNDFMGPLIYVSDMPKYTNSIYLRMSMDGDVGFQWNRILAMSLISIIPSLIVFFCAQEAFIDGIAAGGVKG